MEQEQEYLDKVMKLLNKEKEEWSQKLEESKKKVVEIRKEMFEENTKGIQTWDDVYELNAMDALVSKYGREYGMDYENWKELLEKLDSPYFGRIDFLEDGETDKDIIYIGTYAIRDTKTFRFYVYDWRSPIASMYYDYELGDAQYEAPIGTIKGTIDRKRQYKITRGMMRYWFDTDMNIEDELLAKALSENTDGKLKVIVSSIQKEQNQVIRALSSDVLYVFGPAGSGKTSVGLHRLAYLLYHNRGKLDARNIVIVTNNEIFSSYISNILPDLGEQEAVMGVFFDYIKQNLPKEYQAHDFYEMIETIMKAGNQKQDLAADIQEKLRVQGIKLKSSPEFLDYLKHYMTTFPFHAIDLMYDTDVVADAKEMQHFLRKDFKEENVKVTLEQVSAFIEKSYNEYFENNREQVQELYYKRTSEYVLEDDLEVFCYKEKVRSIAESKRRFEESNHIDVTGMYLELLKYYLEEQQVEMDVYEYTKQCLEEKHLYYEDAIAMLCIQLLMGKIQPDLHIMQVLIDEAQDYNVLQMYFLKCMYPKSKFTILADSNQALESGFSTNHLKEFQEVFTGRQKLCQLTKSYRSTAPINHLANQLLDTEQKIDYVNRSGKMPQLVCTQNFQKTLVQITKNEREENHSIGMITYTKEQAHELYETLKDQMKVQLIEDSQSELEEEIVILPLSYAKGLEFDCVIGAGDFKSDSARWQNPNSYYLLCTRALHRLYLLSSVGIPEVLQPLTESLEIIQEE